MEQVVMPNEVIEDMLDSIKNPRVYKRSYLDVLIESDIVLAEFEVVKEKYVNKYDNLLVSIYLDKIK